MLGLYRFAGFTGIIAVRRVERIFGRVGLSEIQKIVWLIPTGRIENVVVALVFVGEAGFGKRRCD